MDTDPVVPTPTTELMDTMLLARGLLMLSLLLMLMPTTTDIPPTDTDPMVPTPTTDLMATTLLARGLLMLSPLLMPTTTDTFKLPISTKDPSSSRNENQLPQPATKDL